MREGGRGNRQVFDVDPARSAAIATVRVLGQRAPEWIRQQMLTPGSAPSRGRDFWVRAYSAAKQIVNVATPTPEERPDAHQSR